jgi:hypothetical protein
VEADLLPPGRALHLEGCLFCRGHDGGFSGSEHIFSEALGNTTYVLLPGVVCDRCINGPLALADDALTSFQPIVLLRSERGIPTKAGKPVAARFGNATVYFSAPRTLEVETISSKTTKRMTPRGGELELTTGGPVTASTYRKMARAVWKSALELIYWDHGPAGGFDPVFDEVRAHILGRSETQGWMVSPKKSDPHEQIQLSYETRYVDGRKACPVLLDIFGIRFYTDLLRRDLGRKDIERSTPWPANIWNF